ncbi:hypothetical protein L6452_02115 [Arctium lappa]|uniref:Uncharacterized protein n=1 Tax=Arctium lappa TaxID=4217 RepID=A0ACB9FK14_ARCLA|nr:hypothetical protein L6452_02115 [Arctium lappa]
MDAFIWKSHTNYKVHVVMVDGYSDTFIKIESLKIALGSLESGSQVVDRSLESGNGVWSLDVDRSLPGRRTSALNTAGYGDEGKQKFM